MAPGIFASRLALVLTGQWVLTLFQPMVVSENSVPDNITVSFSLYKKDTPEDAPEIAFFNENDALTFKAFEPSKETVVAIHGHIRNHFVMEIFRDAFLTKYLHNEDVNLIIVDWIKLANDLDLLVLMANTDYVGRQVAKLIRILRKTSSNVMYFHILGIDNGCMVAAIAGYKLRELRPERFTALDPPHKLVFEFPKWKRLLRTSADLVEAIHTSGRLTGTLEPVGHRDFYVNGGTWPQPGCEPDETGECSIYTSLDSYTVAIFKRFEATHCEGYKKYMDNLCLHHTKINLFNNATLKEIPQGKYFVKYVGDMIPT